MTATACCAVPGCRRLADGEGPVCGQHRQRLPAATYDGLLTAWRVYELGQRSTDANEYTRLLREALRELVLISPPHQPVQLRLVK